MGSVLRFMLLSLSSITPSYRALAKALSCLLVALVFFLKQCSTYTASSNLATYITRYQPSCWSTMISLVPLPTSLNGFQWSGSSPTCTWLSCLPASRRASGVNRLSSVKSRSELPRQLMGFSEVCILNSVYQNLYENIR